jgi:hypothetical protein
MSKRLSRREKWLLKEALLLLEEAEMEDNAESAESDDTQQDDSENETVTDVSKMNADQMAKALEAKLANSDLAQTVKFLNDSMKANPEAMKTVLLDPKYSGSGDEPWDFDGTISDDGVDKEGKPKYKVTGGTAVPISKIKPTQATIDLQKSVGWCMSSSGSLKWLYENPNSEYSDARLEPIAAMEAGDTIYVLDGHHRWSAQGCMKGPEGKIAAAMLTIPGSASGQRSAEDFLKTSQMGIAAYVMRTDPTTAAEKGLPFAPGGKPGSISTTGDAFEILMNPPEIQSNWNDIFMKTSHDSGKLLGGPIWMKMLVDQDPTLKVPWLKNYEKDESVDEAMKNIVEVYEAMDKEPEFKSKQFEEKPNKNSDKENYAKYKAEEEEWENKVYKPWAEGIKDKWGNLEEDARLVWSTFGVAFQKNWEKVTSGGGMPDLENERQVMPQFGGDKKSYTTKGGMGGMLKQAQQDPGNYGKPYTNESIDLRRWNKLAGLLKD